MKMCKLQDTYFVSIAGSECCYVYKNTDKDKILEAISADIHLLSRAFEKALDDFDEERVTHCLRDMTRLKKAYEDICKSPI